MKSDLSSLYLVLYGIMQDKVSREAAQYHLNSVAVLDLDRCGKKLGCSTDWVRRLQDGAIEKLLLDPKVQKLAALVYQHKMGGCEEGHLMQRRVCRSVAVE